MPNQDNLREYYRMASWVRPGTLGTVEYFNRHFMKPIEDGMARDAVTEAVAMQVAKSKELYELMETFTQRRDNAILKNELPPLQEAILHIRQSPLQRSLYAAYKKHSAKNDDKNFFRAYKSQFLVNNHPGTLLIASRSKPGIRRTLPASSCLATPNTLYIQQKLSSTSSGDVIELLSDTDGDDSDDEEPLGTAGIVADSTCAPTIKAESTENVFTCDMQPTAEVEPTEELWWKPVAALKGEGEFLKIEQGKKLILLLQILAHSQELGDKVVVFSQSLPTLDFIENILNTDWEVHVHNRKSLCPKLKGSTERLVPQIVGQLSQRSTTAGTAKLFSFPSKQVE
jgi:transcriptional regulator ATRX